MDRRGMSHLTLGHCLICFKCDNDNVSAATDLQFSSDTFVLNERTEIVCRFWTLVSRYLDMSSKYFHPEMMISRKISQSKHLTHACDACFPWLVSFCQMYDLWQLLQVEMNDAVQRIAVAMKLADNISGSPSDRNKLIKKLAALKQTIDVIDNTRNNFLQQVEKKKQESLPRLSLIKQNIHRESETTLRPSPLTCSNQEEISTKPSTKNTKDGENSRGKGYYDIPLVMAPKVETTETEDEHEQDLTGDFLSSQDDENYDSFDESESDVKDVNQQVPTSQLNVRSTSIQQKPLDPVATITVRIVADKSSPEATESHKNESRGVQLKFPPGKTFTCKVCSKSFAQFQGLYQHKQIHQTSRQLYKCNFCTKSYLSKQSLTAHIRTRHTGFKPFRCEVCKKSFTTQKAVSYHAKIHKEERSLPCKICDKYFTNSWNLISHQLMEHPSNVPKPFSCVMCSASFRKLPQLENHMRTHTGEKPYNCAGCDKSFAQNTALTTHRRTHSGEKPYQCSLCLRRFAQRSNLLTHRRIGKCTITNQIFQITNSTNVTGESGDSLITQQYSNTGSSVAENGQG